MQKKSLKIEYTYTTLDLCTYADLLREARMAAKNAYAPYSKFNVGCAIQYNELQIYTGNNQENASYPSGLCAERVALFGLKAQNPSAIINAMAVYAPTVENEIPSPCCACRQVMSEMRKRQSSPIPLALLNRHEEVWVFDDVYALIPFDFNRDQLLPFTK